MSTTTSLKSNENSDPSILTYVHEISQVDDMAN